VSDTPPTTAALRALLLARSDEPAPAVASALYEQARGDADPAALLAALAVDGDLAPRQRALALLGCALALAAHPAAAAPEAALDAIEDPDLGAAAIDGGVVAALTGVLRAAPLDGSLRATRKLIGRRCLAAGVFGPHVARLLADGGDREGAAHAGATDLVEHLRAGNRGPELWAWLHLVLTWGEDQGLLFGDLIRALEAADPDASQRLGALLDDLPGVTPERVARAQARIQWELAHLPPQVR
jgi:hypothetical protein